MSRILVVLLAASIAANVFLLYRVLDVGVTTTYEGSEIKALKQQQAQIQKVFPLLQKGMSRDALLGVAHGAGLEVIEKTPDQVYVGAIEFVLKDGMVVGVKFD
jgi:hypothetical protein